MIAYREFKGIIINLTYLRLVKVSPNEIRNIGQALRFSLFQKACVRILGMIHIYFQPRC